MSSVVEDGGVDCDGDGCDVCDDGDHLCVQRKK